MNTGSRFRDISPAILKSESMIRGTGIGRVLQVSIRIQDNILILPTPSGAYAKAHEEMSVLKLPSAATRHSIL